ncbi:hypothetical protein DSN25_11845 [Salmonella enterica subsp. salamae]|nr:hypothetical protein [Salmonella enterica subsp. salamae]ECJ4595399.1 hypothetical protein [Salmonella enterica subsp. salamae]
MSYTKGLRHFFKAIPVHVVCPICSVHQNASVSEYVSNLAKLFNETIASGFINLPKFAFFLLSTLRVINQEDNFLNINA